MQYLALIRIIIVPVESIIQIHNFRQVHDSIRACHLSEWILHGIIIHGIKKVPTIILMIVYINFSV